jgi:hypothetical protein
MTFFLIAIGLLLIAVAVAFMSRLYRVGPETAQLYARLSLPQFVVFPGTPSPSSDPDYNKRWNVEHFLDSRGIGPFEPERPGERRDIYDVDRRPLFRDFTELLSNGTELRARMAATTKLGVPLVSIGVNDKPSDIPKLLAKAEVVANSQDPKLVRVEGDRALVCYAYPALGLLCREENSGKLWAVDLISNDLSEIKSVRERRAEERREGGAHRSWSSYDQPPPGRRTWKYLTRFLGYWKTSWNLRRSNATLSLRRDGRILNVRLERQHGSVDCAIAAAHMVLTYDKINVTRDQIVHAMGFEGVPLTAEQQMRGYQQLTERTGFKPILKELPTFDEVQVHIDRGRPFASDLNGMHARVTIGWNRKPGADRGQRYIYVNDPEGSRYFETWGAVIVNHHIYIEKTETK